MNGQTNGEAMQPERVLVGNCPHCGRVIVMCNNGEAWPLASCVCGWVDATTAIVNRARREHGWARTLRVYVKPGPPNLVRLPVGATVGVESIDQADGALIVVLPPDHDTSTETESVAVRWFQWRLPDNPINADLIRTRIGKWGDAQLCEMEAF